MGTALRDPGDALLGGSRRHSELASGEEWEPVDLAGALGEADGEVNSYQSGCGNGLEEQGCVPSPACSLTYSRPNSPNVTFISFPFKSSIYLFKTILVLALFSSCVHSCQICARERKSLAQTATDLYDKSLYLPMFAKGMLQA